MAPPPSPALTDDLIGEVLLCLPPGDPACLVRASLVCKPWRRLVSDRAFLRRYRAFHRTPPVLGFLQDEFINGGFVPRFVPTTQKASPVFQPAPDGQILDCRHGRVLLRVQHPRSLDVWDPITGGLRRFSTPVDMDPDQQFSAAVLCASDGCRHLECSGGPFLVVLVSMNFDEDDDGGDDSAWASFYSSETSVWSASTSIYVSPSSFEVNGSLLAGDALYFILEFGERILKYDLIGGVLSVISTPPFLELEMLLLTMAEDGELGIAVVKDYTMYLWSWRTVPDSVGEWVQGRVIELDMMISISIGDPSTRIYVAGFAEGTGSILMSSKEGIFTVELKSGQVRKIGNRDSSSSLRGEIDNIFPFMSFYTPDLASARLQVPTRTE